jgi:hypothetical protein
MRNPQAFDYNQPSRDALAGIYVEVSDGHPDTRGAELSASQEKPAVAQVEQLFGLTLSVDDADSVQRPSWTPQA